MKPLLIGLFLSLVLTTPSAAATFSFRGLPLGMPLEGFKTVVYPDDPASGLKPYCTDGPYSSLSEWRMQAVGIVHCGFMGEVEPRNYSGPGLDLKLGIGDYFTPHGLYTFAFAPDERGVDRLYKIKLTAHIDAFQSIVAQMTALYGPASRITEAPKDWPEGSPYRSAYAWRDGNSWILVEAGMRVRPNTYDEGAIDILFIDNAKDQALRKTMAAARRNQTRRYAAAPYLFRYMALDTRLEVFKSVPYGEGGSVLCTDSGRVSLADWRLSAAGVVHCAYAANESAAHDPDRPVYLQHSLGIKDVYARGGSYHYAFAPDGHGVRRLYRISLRAPLSAFEAVVAQTTARYGPAVSVMEKAQDWPVGSPYRYAYTWQSAGHRIVVQASEKRMQGPGYYPEDGMTIEYTSIALAEAVERSVAALAGPRNIEGK